MPLPTPEPPTDTIQVLGIFGGIVGAVYSFWKMVKAWPLRESALSRKAILERLEKLEGFEGRLNKVEAQNKQIENALAESFWNLDQKLDLLSDRLKGLNRRFDRRGDPS